MDHPHDCPDARVRCLTRHQAARAGRSAAPQEQAEHFDSQLRGHGLRVTFESVYGRSFVGLAGRLELAVSNLVSEPWLARWPLAEAPSVPGGTR
jgi:hypothetical protein